MFGGIAIAAGITASAVNRESGYNDRTGEYEQDLDWTDTLVGAAIGAPLIATGIVSLVKSNHAINHLRRRRLSIAPIADGIGLCLTAQF